MIDPNTRAGEAIEAWANEKQWVTGSALDLFLVPCDHVALDLFRRYCPILFSLTSLASLLSFEAYTISCSHGGEDNVKLVPSFTASQYCGIRHFSHVYLSTSNGMS